MIRDCPFPHDYDADVLATPPAQAVVHEAPGLGPGLDGMLVRFSPQQHPSWIGLFRLGTLSVHGATGVFPTPNPNRAVVVAKGSAYEVEVAEAGGIRLLVPDLVLQVSPASDESLLLLADPWEVYAYGAHGIRWRSGRLGPEGLRIVDATKSGIRVSIEDQDGKEDVATLDLATGRRL